MEYENDTQSDIKGVKDVIYEHIEWTKTVLVLYMVFSIQFRNLKREYMFYVSIINKFIFSAL